MQIAGALKEAKLLEFVVQQFGGVLLLESSGPWLFDESGFYPVGGGGGKLLPPKRSSFPPKRSSFPPKRFCDNFFPNSPNALTFFSSKLSLCYYQNSKENISPCTLRTPSGFLPYIFKASPPPPPKEIF